MGEVSYGLHVPVMLDEMLDAVKPQPGEVVVDATFGAGGYSRALLTAGATVYAIDRDPTTKMLAEALARDFPGHFFYLSGAFGNMHGLLAAKGVHQVSAVVMDIGVSSMQLDQASRGFSFMNDGPLDMRMSGAGRTAADIVNKTDENALADILYTYGEEKQSRKIARAIVRARDIAPFETTQQLSSMIEKTIGKAGKIHPATRSFQALRIAVNDELDELEHALIAAENLLGEDGRLVVVTFHSLEDRIVKKFMQSRAGTGNSISRHAPDAALQQENTAHANAFTLHRKKAVLASDEECQKNPRARSAKLRCAIRNKITASGDRL